MKLPLFILLLVIATPCAAQVPCSSPDLDVASERVQSLQKQLEAIEVSEMETTVPSQASDLLTQLKDSLSNFADAALTCVAPSADPGQLQSRFAQLLNANQPDLGQSSAADGTLGSYGRNLRVQVGHPSDAPNLLRVEFSIQIECGDDHLLLVYAPVKGAWKEKIRWQAPPLKKISDAFGDFFISAVLGGDSDRGLRVVAAHGTPWCTSRFSGFDIDLLSPAPAAKSPEVLWHTSRGYSRGDFEPKLKASGNTFELRLDASSMDVAGYVRRVIYRYRVDEKQEVHRVQPIAANARGFVEEWLSAPWPESQGFLAPGATPDLKQIHEQFQRPVSGDDSESVTHSYGPVRACSAVGTFQVQIDSTLEKMIPGEPRGDSVPGPAHYFHVREIKNGYLMLSAPIAPDPACMGTNLMPNTGE